MLIPLSDLFLILQALEGIRAANAELLDVSFTWFGVSATETARSAVH